MVSLEKHKEWEGTAESLAKLVGQMMQGESKFGKVDFIPNERLVRDYVSRGILSAPKRRGKEAIFGFEQLVQFLACRVMLADGWPLSKISEDFKRTSFQEILGHVTDKSSKNEALDLIKSFRTQQVENPDLPLSSKASSDVSVSPNSSSSLEGGGARSNSFMERQRRRFALRQVGNDFSTTVKYDFTALQLATWLVLLIDRNRFAKITMDEAESIGLAVTAGLLNQDVLTEEQLHEAAKNTLYELEEAKKAKFELEKDLKDLQRKAEHQKSIVAQQENEVLESVEKLQSIKKTMQLEADVEARQMRSQMKEMRLQMEEMRSQMEKEMRSQMDRRSAMEEMIKISEMEKMELEKEIEWKRQELKR